MLKFKYLVFIISLFFIDFFSKSYILKNLSLLDSMKVFPGLNFTLVFNQGIAYGIGWQNSIIFSWLLLIFTALVIIWLITWLVLNIEHSKLLDLGLSLVIGGALGNFYDRAFYGYVIDFLDFYINNQHWYIFNLADVFISIGGTLVVSFYLFYAEKKK